MVVSSRIAEHLKHLALLLFTYATSGVLNYELELYSVVAMMGSVYDLRRHNFGSALYEELDASPMSVLDRVLEEDEEHSFQSL